MSVVKQLSSQMSGCLRLCPIFSCPFFLFVSTLTGLAFCLSACISVCLHFSLCPGSCGIVTKCWLHTWQAPLPACLAFWGFQTLRIPLPGFLSSPPPLAPVLLCLLLFRPVSLGWACGALPLSFPYGLWIKTADFWLLPESPSVWLQGFPDCA